MSGYSEDEPPTLPSPAAKTEVILDLPTVCKMLPLVQRIVAELLAVEQQHAQLLGEQESLDRNRRNLSWPERKRRYDIQDDIDRRRTPADAILFPSLKVLELPSSTRLLAESVSRPS